MTNPQPFLAALLSYISGSLAFSYWLPLWIKGIDVTKVGSGNPGATNVLRNAGKGLGMLCLFLDGAKGAAAVYICYYMDISMTLKTILPMLAVAGHIFSPFLGFKGGKGVAVSAGVFLALAPQPMLVSLGGFVLTVLLTRYVSLGSILAAIVFPWSVHMLQPAGNQKSILLYVGSAVALMIIFRHLSNLKRLIKGEEAKISWKK